ncbi:hypothetical protein AB0M20_03280 [Actinoplanes sp. NPDC051633]|uniref:hypothetical protein n=1 Tax=Actinoplanes sp. NPDC051633 TaxID=3155670 RepID=UPI00341797F7
MIANQWFEIVGGIVSIIAFVFSVWVWMKSDMKVRELRAVIQTAYDVCGSIMWEISRHPGDDDSVRLRHVESALGQVAAIQTLTSKYADRASSRRRTDIDALAERGVLWPSDMIWGLENSGRVREVWLVTPDFEPDRSDKEVGSSVGRNVRRGTRYVYFVPEDIGDLEELKAGLLENLGLAKAQRLMNRITIVPVDRKVENNLFQRGNSILFFEGDPATAAFYALEEVVLTKIPTRGSFWQEHPKSVADELRRELRRLLVPLSIERHPGVAPGSINHLTDAGAGLPDADEPRVAEA